MEWMLPEDGDLADLAQIDVQRFLWYFLPAKWLIDSREHHEVAWSLGDLLAAAGLDRYAAICRDPVTHRVIDAYEESYRSGIAAHRSAQEESGIEPPDTDVVAWGSVFGVEEAAVLDQVSGMLEAAIESGGLVVGSRGWKVRAKQLTAAFLTAPDANPTRRDIVRAERAEWWSRSGGPNRQRLCTAALERLRTEPILDGPVLSESLAPARALLEGVADGVMLTQAGYLPKTLAVHLNDRFDWYRLPGYKVTSEGDIAQLLDLHELLRQTRLLTKRGRKLTVSAEGRRCLAHDDRLFRTLALHLLAGTDFASDVAAMKTCHLLLEADIVLEDDLTDAVLTAVAERWRTTSGEAVTRRDVQFAGRWRYLARTLAWLDEGEYQHPGGYQIRLTPAGRAAAVIGIQAHAFSPRHHP